MASDFFNILLSSFLRSLFFCDKYAKFRRLNANEPLNGFPQPVSNEGANLQEKLSTFYLTHPPFFFFFPSPILFYFFFLYYRS